ERRRLGRPHGSVALAHRTRGVRARGRRGPQALPRDLQQAEPRDPPDVVSRLVGPHRLADRTLDVGDVARLAHVDEVDDDDAAEVAEAELAGDLDPRLKVRLVRGVLLARAPHGA